MADAATSGAASPPGIWMFVAADCTGFAIFFLVFVSERMKAAPLFDASSRLLDTRLGLANTLILVTSSWLVARAIDASANGRPRAAMTRMMAGTAVGACFAVLKILEYREKLTAGITPATNDFFMFYFILTGIHFLHYAIGLAVLAAMIAALDRARRTNREVAWIEAGGLYWHMVDLLWLFLYPMLYLLRSH